MKIEVADSVTKLFTSGDSLTKVFTSILDWKRRTGTRAFIQQE
jgi:hypothetical protein